MLELTLNTNVPKEGSTLKQLQLITAQSLHLHHIRDVLVVNPPDSQYSIVVGLDQFMHNQETRQLYHLSLEVEEGVAVGGHNYYFAKSDVSEMAAFAMTLMWNNGEKEFVGKEHSWLFNKHTAVTRTINRVAHGSRRVYAISAFRALQPQRWSELSQQGKQIHEESVAIETQFERCVELRNDGERIPVHHAFYMLFEDQLLNGNVSDNYTFDRYRKEFENRLEVADLQKLDHINREWYEFWHQHFNS